MQTLNAATGCITQLLSQSRASRKMKSINWNQMSDLRVIERINREILLPLGLAVSRGVESGKRGKALVAGDVV